MALLGGLIGESPGLVAIRAQVEQFLQRQSGSRRLPPVLILGETGTGKGLLARAIHDNGPRAAGPFVAINCAAIPETLLEAELFGFEQGAFTDARQAKAGLLQTAGRGTLFLDEIGLLPQGLQAKLLTVLEDRMVRRLGSTRSEAVDLSIISATSEDVKAGQRRRRIREDLFHRLAVVTFQLPALRERGQDIITLAEHFLTRTCTDYGLPAKTLAEDARAVLLAYRWPGNVRELANLMERVALLTDSGHVMAGALALGEPRRRPAPPPPDGTVAARGQDDTSLEQAVGEVERARILEALKVTHWNIYHAADRLGVTRNTLRYRLKKYGLRAPSATDVLTTSAEPMGLIAEPTTAAKTVSLQWERRYLALLSADFGTALSVEPVFDATPMLETLIEKIHTFGGQIEEVSPRGLVAGFGLEPIEDAPRRAAHAALAIQKISGHASHGAMESSGVRVGLHVGEFWVARVDRAARVGHESKREALAQIETLMRNAAPGTVLVSEATRPFLERRFVVVPFAAGDGMDRKCWQLAGLGRSGLGLGEQLTPFVARGRELGQLEQTLELTRKGHGQIVAVVGEAGVGKSRLLWEFINPHLVRDEQILVSGAVSFGKPTPYLPVVALLQAYFQIAPNHDTPTILANVTEKVLSLERGLAPTIAALLAILDVPVEDDQWRALDSQQRRQRMLEATQALFLEASRLQPIIVVLEDLHWIDSETQAVLDALVESLSRYRVLLLVSYRADYQHAWGSKSYYTQLRLDPLSPEDAQAFLDSLTGAEEVTGALKAILIERTGGNPFFLEEIVRTLVETGVLVGDRGAYRLARSPDAIQVPATVRAVLAARVDRLPPEDRTLLQTAAVIGKDLSFALLLAVARLPEAILRAGLNRLRGSEFLFETRLVPEPEYTFKHALTHEVVYDGLLHERRRELHARTVDAIEVLHRDRLGGESERLAHHALRGELWEKAVQYLRQAGGRSAARSAFLDASGWFEQALSVLEKLPESPATLGQAFDVRLELWPVLNTLGETRSALERLREAGALADRLNDERQRGRVAAMMTNFHSLLGELDEALVVGNRALQIAGRLGDLRLRILAMAYLEQAHYVRGDYDRAIELGSEILSVLPTDWLYEHFGHTAPISVADRSWLVMSLAELGRFDEATERAGELIRLIEPMQQHWNSVGLAYRAAAMLHLARGDWAEARELGEQGLAVSSSGNFVVQLPSALAGSAWALAQLGEASEALNRVRLSEQVIERFATKKIVANLAWSYHALGRATLLLGRLDEARRLGDRAVEFSPRHPGLAAHALLLLGDIASHPDCSDGEKGEVHYHKALTLAAPRGMRPLIAHCRLSLGKLYRRTGKARQAHENLQVALTMYREMDMRFWLEKAEAETSRLPE
jgi:DNA-binding NtrC family response regulator/tetratricopeptide (TPR) repeat protein